MADATIPATQASTSATTNQALYEVVNGERRELPPMGAYQSWIAGWLDQLLGSFVTSQRLGRVAPEMLFQIDPITDLQRRPDVAFVSYERWPRNQQVPDSAAWDVVPDLAIEVISPTNTAMEVIDKLADYFRAGVRIVWVVYPSQRHVYVYDSPTSPTVRTIGQDLEGGSVLPGLRLSLAKLFEVEDEPA